MSATGSVEYLYGPQNNIGKTADEYNGHTHPFNGTYYESGPLTTPLDFFMSSDIETSTASLPLVESLGYPEATGLRLLTTNAAEVLQAKASIGLAGVLEAPDTVTAGYGYNGFLSYASTEVGTYILNGSIGVGQAQGTLYGCGVRTSSAGTTGYEGFVAVLGATTTVLFTIPDVQILHCQAVDNGIIYCISQPVNTNGVPTAYTYSLHSADGEDNYALYTYPGATWKGNDTTYGANRFFIAAGNSLDCVVTQQCAGDDVNVTNKFHLFYKMRGTQDISSVNRAWTVTENTVGNPVQQNNGGNLQWVGALVGAAAGFWTYQTMLNDFTAVETRYQDFNGSNGSIPNLATQSLCGNYYKYPLYLRANGDAVYYTQNFGSTTIGGASWQNAYFGNNLVDRMTTDGVIPTGYTPIQAFGRVMAYNPASPTNPPYNQLLVVLKQTGAEQYITRSYAGTTGSTMVYNVSFTNTTFGADFTLSPSNSVGQVFLGGVSIASAQQLEVQLNFVTNSLTVLPGRKLPPVQAGLSVTQLTTPGGVSFYVTEDRTFQPFADTNITAAVTQLIITVTGGNAAGSLPDTVSGWVLSQNGLAEAATYNIRKTALAADIPTDVLHAFTMTVADNEDVPSTLDLSVDYLAPEQAQPDTSGDPITASTLTSDGQGLLYSSYNSTSDESTVSTAELDDTLGLRLEGARAAGVVVASVAGRVWAIAALSIAQTMYTTVSSAGVASLILTNDQGTAISTFTLTGVTGLTSMTLEAMSTSTALLTMVDGTPAPYLQLVTVTNGDTLNVSTNSLAPADDSIGRPIANNERTAAFVSIGNGAYIYQLPASYLQGVSVSDANINSNITAFVEGTSNNLSLSDDYLYQPNGNTVRRIPLQNWSTSTTGWETVVTGADGLVVEAVVSNGPTGYVFASSDGGATSKLYRYDLRDNGGPTLALIDQVLSYTNVSVQTLRQEQFVFHSNKTIGVVGSGATSSRRLFPNLAPTPNPTVPEPTEQPTPAPPAPTSHPKNKGASKKTWQNTVYGTSAAAAVLLGISIWLIVWLITLSR